MRYACQTVFCNIYFTPVSVSMRGGVGGGGNVAAPSIVTANVAINKAGNSSES